jgi:hypothetical protein
MKEYRLDLKPCPFCGGVPYEEAYDRLIVIGCDVCNFHIHGRGLVTSEMTSVKINESEYYDCYAHEKIEKRWNRRIEAEKRGEQKECQND